MRSLLHSFMPAIYMWIFCLFCPLAGDSQISIRITSVKGQPNVELHNKRIELHAGSVIDVDKPDRFTGNIDFKDTIGGYVKYLDIKTNTLHSYYANATAKTLESKPEDNTNHLGVLAVRGDSAEPCFRSMICPGRKTLNYEQLESYFTGSKAYLNWGMDTICISGFEPSATAYFSLVFMLEDEACEKRVDAKNGCIYIPAQFARNSAEAWDISLVYTQGSEKKYIASHIHFIDILSEAGILAYDGFSKDQILPELEKQLFGQTLSTTGMDNTIGKAIEKNLKLAMALNH